MNDRLERQLAFLMEMDKLKSVYRQSMLIDRSRHENDAEHSWHLTMMAIVLAEHANVPDLDVLRVLKMLMIHDVVEIDAGDTFAYDEKGYEDKAEREQKAADRLFGFLPDDQRDECQALWHEFEERQTAESRFACALDRLQPMLLNYHTEGAAWQKHKVTSDKVFKRNAVIQDGSEMLWDYAAAMIREAVEKGYLRP